MGAFLFMGTLTGSVAKIPSGFRATMALACAPFRTCGVKASSAKLSLFIYF
jgi:hypothetical protein